MFYIYALFRPNGIVCYIGKGKGYRINRHEQMAARKDINCNPHLANIIKNAGGLLPKVIIRDSLTEEEAFALEILFIKVIGREIHGGPLVNMTNGGDGVSGLVFSDESKEKISGMSKKFWDDSVNKARMKDIHLKAWANPERRKRASETSKRVWDTPEIAAKITESHKARWDRPGEREAQSERLRSAGQRPEVIANYSAGATAMWANRSATQREQDAIRLKQTSQNAWAKASTREKAKASAKASWSDPEIRAKRAQSMKIGWIKRKAANVQS